MYSKRMATFLYVFNFYLREYIVSVIPNNVRNSGPFKAALYGTADCRSWLSLFTKQTKITTRCREHDLQGPAVLHAQNCSREDNDFPAEDLYWYCSNSISPANKNTDYFIIEIQKKVWYQFKMHPR